MFMGLDKEKFAETDKEADEQWEDAVVELEVYQCDSEFGSEYQANRRNTVQVYTMELKFHFTTFLVLFAVFETIETGPSSYSYYRSVSSSSGSGTYYKSEISSDSEVTHSTYEMKTGAGTLLKQLGGFLGFNNGSPGFISSPVVVYLLPCTLLFYVTL